jgi:hypothetical protein
MESPKYPKIEIIEYAETRELEPVGKDPVQVLAIGETDNRLIVKMQSSDPNFPDGKHYIIRAPAEMMEDLVQVLDAQFQKPAA